MIKPIIRHSKPIRTLKQTGDTAGGAPKWPPIAKMEFPVLLDMESPKIYAYSIYSAIAEKFEAFVSLGSFNSRYKDFYDIYVIASKTIFDGSELQKAIIETFKHRKTNFKDIIAFTDEYKNDPLNNTRWNSFLKKNKSL